MDEYNARLATWQGETLIFGPLAETILEVIDGKRAAGDFSFTIPVVTTESCVFCQVCVAPCTANDRSYYGEVFIDDQGVTRVDVAHPHTCAEMQRHDEFLRAPLDGPEEWEGR